LQGGQIGNRKEMSDFKKLKRGTLRTVTLGFMVVAGQFRVHRHLGSFSTGQLPEKLQARKNFGWAEV